jgi:dolichol kinase
MKSKKELPFEIKRQAFHLVSGTFLGLLVLVVDKQTALALLAVAIIVGVYISQLFVKKKRIPLVGWFVDRFEREGALPGNGLLTAVMGGFIALAFFDSFIVFISLLLLAYVDSFSTVIGKSIGKTRILGKKTLEGAIGGFVAGFFIAAMFLPMEIAALAAIVATIVEVLPLDDNISIPPLVGAALTYIKL